MRAKSGMELRLEKVSDGGREGSDEKELRIVRLRGRKQRLEGRER